MILKNHRILSLTLLLTCGLIGSVAVAKPLAKSAGFSGTVGINMGVSDTQSQFHIDDDNEQTQDLSNDGKAVSTEIFFPFFRLDYTTSDLQTQYFIGQSPDKILNSAIQYEIGVKHQFDERQSMTFAYIPDVPFLKETWSDPFLINAPREKSDIDSSAVRLAYKFSPVQIEYSYASYSIENEQSGSQMSVEDQASLNRDSDYQRLSLESLFPLWQGIYGKANVFYGAQDAKGESQSFDEFHYSLSIMTKYERHFVSVQAAFSDREYNAKNPIFGEVQKDDVTRYSFIYSYSEPFDIEGTNLNIIYQNKKNDANIAFYDSSTKLFSVGMSYSFN
ncbi:DUF2860 family protein [Moritella sp. 36]|uniref:DUF2860 family protein n=1 Tax=Moritella sp. 36 TaxID=2746233 RepID=UPI001BAB0A5E|nr:DUF2860 family protein [Moritella sp. 36]QUM88453.1 DUF2860 family protein [Moritella sp. 36]